MKIWKIPGGLCLKLENSRGVIIEDFRGIPGGCEKKWCGIPEWGGGGVVKNEIEFQGL